MLVVVNKYISRQLSAATPFRNDGSQFAKPLRQLLLFPGHVFLQELLFAGNQEANGFRFQKENLGTQNCALKIDAT